MSRKRPSIASTSADDCKHVHLLGTPLGQLAAEERAAIDAILQETLERSLVLARVRAHFAAPRSGGGRC